MGHGDVERILLPRSPPNAEIHTLEGRVALTRLEQEGERTIRHQDGQNLLTLHFGPPLVGYHVSEDYGASGRFEDEEDPMDNGTSLYYSATGSGPGDIPLLIDNDTWIQGKYPVLYETAHADSAHRATETTHFTFTHRPDLFPADQIIPGLELGREHSGPPPRIPAQPRFSQRSQ
jgi:hypothetical protein